MLKWKFETLVQYYCDRLEFIRIHHFKKIKFIAELH